MSEYWYIASEKLKFRGIEEITPINLELWRDLVEEDADLFWYDCTPHGRKFFQMPNTSKNLKKVMAHMDMNKKNGHGSVQFNYKNSVGHIAIIHTRKTLNRIEKYLEIAKALKVNFYRNKTLMNEKQMDKLRMKLSK